MPAQQRRRPNPHFFARENDGSVRLRIRFPPAQADLIEKAAGTTPLLQWIDDVLMAAATKEASQLDDALQAPPPLEERRHA